mgnify:CR=1 FL=1
MKLSLERNLMIGFGISLLILIASSVVSFLSIRNLLNSSSLVRNTNEVLQKLEQTFSIVKDAEAGQRGFLITGDEEFLASYNGAYQQAESLIGEIEKLTLDNPIQQKNIYKLDELIGKRFLRLQELIDIKRQNGSSPSGEMKDGKIFMDSVRAMINEMSSQENLLLQTRTEKFDRFSSYTPKLIIIAALLAILITVLFYIRMTKDVGEKSKLQEELVRKDADTRNRINIIQGIAEKISAGDYSVRVNNNERDDLGNISVALNKMADSLEKSFTALSHKEWLKAGIAGLNDAIIGDDNMQSATKKYWSLQQPTATAR